MSRAFHRRRRIGLEAGVYERCIGALVPPERDPRLAGIPLPVQWGAPSTTPRGS